MNSQTPTPTTDTSATPTGAPSTAPEQGAGVLQSIAEFGAYVEAMEQSDSPLLGYLVLYSVYESRVTRDDLERWFLQLGLDDKFLPPPIRECDAYEQVTGKRGVRATYRLSTDPNAGKRRASGEQITEATLMIRHVSRDNLKVVRHLVREVRDEAATQLSYDTHMAEVVFWRDPLGSGRPGAGTLQVLPDETAIAALSESEQAKVRATLTAIETTYREQRAFYNSDRLRTVVRTYVEALNAVRIKSSGGAYFVHRTHADVLASLRELVSRFGAGSMLTRIPLPDQDEMREMVIHAFTSKTREDLDKLTTDILAARDAGASEPQVQALYKRYRALLDATSEHSELLKDTLQDTRDALQSVNDQVAQLMAQTW